MERMLEGKRIFLVEDDILNVSVFAKSLAYHGAMIYQDILGYGIVQHIMESLPIDLILLDVMLKRGQNGFDIFEKIKTEPRLASIPVVAVTSLDSEEMIPKAQEAGFSGFISKPVNIAELPKQVERVLRGEKIWAVSHQ
jgi:CheY-like chemotaxis protein